MTKRYSAYLISMAQTTNEKGRILLMLYDGAIKFVRFARMGIEKKNPKIRGENISKVMAILGELDCALDREIGGDLAENLSNLYSYMMDRMTAANTRNDTVALDEVERLLRELKEAFEEAVKRTAHTSPALPEGRECAVKGGVHVAA